MADPTVVPLVKSDAGFTTNERPIDMHTRIYQNYPQMFPLQAIMTRLTEETTTQDTVYWTESEILPRVVYVSAAASSGATTITVPSYTYLNPYDLLYIPTTEEYLHVRSISTTTITVKRAVGGTTAAAIPAGTPVQVLSPSYPEAADTATGRSVVNSEKFNYTQEMVEFIKTSDRVMNTSTHFGGKGSKRQENQRKMFYIWRTKLEMTLMLGQRDSFSDTTSGNIVKLMGGLAYYLKDGDNYLDVNGVLTESLLDEYLTNLYTAMPDEYPRRLAMLASPKVINYINQIAKPRIRISPNTKAYGMRLDTYFGAVNLDLIPHPQMTGPTLQEWAFVVDFDYLVMKWQHRAMMFKDVYTGRANYVEDKMYGLATLILGNQKRHGWLAGIKG